MKLADLDPRWFVLEEGGPRVGLTFDCPHCREQRLGVHFHNLGEEAADDSYILAHSGGPAHIWTLSGAEDFSSLTLSPSVDASATGHWHGFVQNGQIVGGI